jgi:ribosomal protein S18 acetylase RimI-like enzyme
LAVDDSYRGSGIGKKLIEVAETSSIAGLSRINRATTLYAVTPTCLTAARKLYESCGYCDNDLNSFSAGALRMKVYSKSFGKGSTWRTSGQLK